MLTSPSGQATDTSPPPGRGLRRVLVVAVVVLLVLGAVVGAHLWSTQDVTRVGFSQLTAPRPDRSFAWVADGAGPFTDEEIRALATRYSTVVIARPHARANAAAQQEDVRRIKAADPDVRVLVYFSASYWFDTNDTPQGWGTSYDPAWSLRDQRTGEVMRFTGVSQDEVADFVDLANPAYRDYALGVLRQWLAATPADGVAFDSAHELDADYPVPRQPELRWGDVLTEGHIQAFNDGLHDLLRRTGDLVGPDGTVLYNGISDQPTLVDRNTGPLRSADATLDEEFCLDLTGEPNPGKLRADLALIQQIVAEGKQVFEKTNIRPDTDPATQAQLGRYCSGAFLLTWQPGATFFKFGPDYRIGELGSDPPESLLDLGEPAGPYREVDGLFVRDFSRGTVLVNLGEDEQSTAVDRGGTLVTDGGAQALVDGGAITVPAQDAAFVVRPSSS